MQRRKTESPLPLLDRARGCLLGGAVGDAVGAPVEFMSLAEIRSQIGPHGITDFEEAYGRKGAITDDTQMTFFTTEGIIRAILRARERGICNPPSVVHLAYLRWLETQGYSANRSRSRHDLGGWLIEERLLHSRRAPGNTCLSALRSGQMGTLQDRINDSKGCGGVMRVAPAGLVERAGHPFEFGCKLAAITHGHQAVTSAPVFLRC